MTMADSAGPGKTVTTKASGTRIHCIPGLQDQEVSEGIKETVAAEYQ